MADVQVENGYTRIANELFEAILGSDITWRQKSLMFALIRKTYGFQKKTDFISLSQLAQMMNLKSKGGLSSDINVLEKMGFIFVEKMGFGMTQKLSINKNYDEWCSQNRNAYNRSQNRNATVHKTGTGCSQNRNATVHKTGTTKETIKENNKETIKDSTTSFKFEVKVGLPKDFYLHPKLVDYGTKKHIPLKDIQKEFEAFCNHAEANNRKLNDWNAGFRNWLLKKS